MPATRLWGAAQRPPWRAPWRQAFSAWWRASRRAGSLELPDDLYGAFAEEAEALCRGLRAGADEDAEAYAAIKAAYRLPRDDARMAALRDTAIREALITAATVPRNNARLAARVAELSQHLRGRSNPSTATDLAVAAALAEAAVLGCALNVEVNASLVPGVPAAETLRAEAEDLRRRHAPEHVPAKEPA